MSRGVVIGLSIIIMTSAFGIGMIDTGKHSTVYVDKKTYINEGGNKMTIAFYKTSDSILHGEMVKNPENIKLGVPTNKSYSNGGAYALIGIGLLFGLIPIVASKHTF
jgi:hypothetical protein